MKTHEGEPVPEVSCHGRCTDCDRDTEDVSLAKAKAWAKAHVEHTGHVAVAERVTTWVYGV